MAGPAFAFLAVVLAVLPAAAQDKSETVTIPDSTVKFDLVSLPGGKARMKTPDGTRDRELDLKPFWIGAREVTWEEYSLYYEARKAQRLDGVTRPSQPDVIDPKEPFPNGEAQGSTHPAISIGWFGSIGYCEWLTRKTGQKYRLPTEAEWEVAAGADPKSAEEFAWFEGNSGKNSHEVGKKKPNGFGLYDILGNAWENCLEPFAPPAQGPAVRGGGWNTPAKDLRATKRQAYTDDWAERDPKRPLRLWWLTDGNFVGFRVVRIPGSSVKDSEALMAKIEVRNLKIVKTGKRPDFLDRISGEIVYSGDAPLDEVEVTVYFFDEDGKPMMKDPKDKPCFSIVYPVLANTYHDNGVREPLAKGGTRTFELDVPHPFLETGPLDLEKVGAKVSYVHAAK